jgi:hypothetical protein
MVRTRVDLIGHVFDRPLAELADDAAALVDELAALAKSGTETDAKIVLADRAPIRVVAVQQGASPAVDIDAIAIASVPGAFGNYAVRWQRRDTSLEARDHNGTALPALPDHQKIIGRGDARMLLTTVLRMIQRPAPALVDLGGGAQYPLLPETTLGRTALSDIVIPDDRLTKVAWIYEWSDDAWWVRVGQEAGNITLNGEAGWKRRELKHDDVVASGLFGVRFLLAH